MSGLVGGGKRSMVMDTVKHTSYLPKVPRYLPVGITLGYSRRNNCCCPAAQLGLGTVSQRLSGESLDFRYRTSDVFQVHEVDRYPNLPRYLLLPCLAPLSSVTTNSPLQRQSVAGAGSRPKARMTNDTIVLTPLD